jgi:threonine/homoserine/homoserine lactone efflux protein
MGFFLRLGLKTLFAKPSNQSASAGGRGLVAAYASTFLLTLTNPMTILAFVAIFAALGVAGAGGSYLSAGLLVLGVFLGSALWWLALSSGVSRLGRTFSADGLRWVNRISGTIILAFGLLALVSLRV